MTQRIGQTPPGLIRLHEAARRDRRLRFNNLLHHVTVELLEKAYYALNRKAASGVDGENWSSYGEGLQERLA
jgi:RNA-directed DNA polymerase